MINVTKTALPPLEEYVVYLKGIWERGWITNNGPLVLELEEKLGNFMKVPHIQYVTNGTIALQIALKLLDITGEVITTPFSYVATTTALLWQGCTPVFADILPTTMCIDPDTIEPLITPRTQAILATHVYGIPCDVERIQEIAKKHNLKVIYDAAHAFGVKYKGRSLVSYGDVSTLSFHATKLFHTVEGGALIVPSNDLSRQAWLYKSFGHHGEEYFSEGINGKNSEFHAAMGLCMLKRVRAFIEARKAIWEFYHGRLNGEPGFVTLNIDPSCEYNYGYFPLLFPNEEALLCCMKSLAEVDVYPRRYFHPSLNRLPYIEPQTCPVSDDIAKRVLCLPLYDTLSNDDAQSISDIVIKSVS